MMHSTRSTMPGTRRPHQTRRTRRELLTTAAAGAIAAPLVLSSRLFGARCAQQPAQYRRRGTGRTLPRTDDGNHPPGREPAALCDVDQRQFAGARKAVAGQVEGGDIAMQKAKQYGDYRKLLDAERRKPTSGRAASASSTPPATASRPSHSGGATAASIRRRKSPTASRSAAESCRTRAACSSAGGGNSIPTAGASTGS